MVGIPCTTSNMQCIPNTVLHIYIPDVASGLESVAPKKGRQGEKKKKTICSSNWWDSEAAAVLQGTN